MKQKFYSSLKSRLLGLGVVLCLGLMLHSAHASASVQASSPNYEVNEVQFGAGGLVNASSPSYQAQENVGALGVGHGSSTNYQAYNGFLTPNVPFLSMLVNTSTLNLGTLSSATTATGTATFNVTAYVDSGYVVYTMSNPPTQEDGHVLKNIASAAASSSGTEQFGMNLVQNLTTCTTPAPANFGANPAPQPNSSYASGAAAAGYNTCGKFQYNKGDIIAQTGSNGWGQTNYTISYIANINRVSVAGSYSMVEDLVVVATF